MYPPSIKEGGVVKERGGYAIPGQELCTPPAIKEGGVIKEGGPPASVL